LLWGQKSLACQFTWTLHKDKFKHNIPRLIDGLLENIRECRLHFSELTLNCRSLGSHSNSYEEF
jgi:hypothetical protein